MAKKNSNYMQEKRFSLNDIILGGCLLCGVVFFAFCLFAVNFYANSVDETELVEFANGDKVSMSDVYAFYKDKISEVAATMTYGDSLSYSLVDINRDGLRELVLKFDSVDSNSEYLFYTFNEASFNSSTEPLVYAGSISSTNCTLYQMNEEDFLVAVGDYDYYVYLDNDVISTFQVSLDKDPAIGTLIPFHDFQDLTYFN